MRQYMTVLSGLMMLCQPVLVSAAPDELHQAELLYLLKHDCGSCHGMTRKGGLGPPLLPANLRDRPRDLLVHTVLDGRPTTPMPPWRGQLTEAEVHWLVEMLLAGEGL
jgi:cytochrome c55X